MLNTWELRNIVFYWLVPQLKPIRYFEVLFSYWNFLILIKDQGLSSLVLDLEHLWVDCAIYLEFSSLHFEKLVIFVFYLFVIVFSNQSSRWQTLNLSYHFGLVIDDVICHFLSTFVLKFVYGIAKNIGYMWFTFHVLCMPRLFLQSSGLPLWDIDTGLLVILLNHHLLLEDIKVVVRDFDRLTLSPPSLLTDLGWVWQVLLRWDGIQIQGVRVYAMESFVHTYFILFLKSLHV